MPGATTLDDGLVSGEHAGARLATDPAAPKFRAPKVREDSVRRAGLLRRLEDEPARPLILLTAPAGYGKTTLLAQWAHESGRPVAWATLDELDAGPDVLADSINEALASRCEFALAPGRMRAQRMLVEVSAADLAMSGADAASLLRKSGRDPESSGVQALVHRTEGWPAILELTAISWSQRGDPAEPLPQPRGDDHLISEYAPISPPEEPSGPIAASARRRPRSPDPGEVAGAPSLHAHRSWIPA